MGGTAVSLRVSLAKFFPTYPQNVQNLRNVVVSHRDAQQMCRVGSKPCEPQSCLTENRDQLGPRRRRLGCGAICFSRSGAVNISLLSCLSPTILPLRPAVLAANQMDQPLDRRGPALRSINFTPSNRISISNPRERCLRALPICRARTGSAERSCKTQRHSR
jgi:hypothetical protein